MSKTLVIVESPAKARTLTKLLGRKYEVLASMGHVRDLPKSQFGVDVDEGFVPKYITIRGKGNAIQELRAASKKADRVLLASDPDREGEAIAWHLEHLLKLDQGKANRIEFNEITKPAVVSAVKNPRKVDVDRVNAQQARRILDRLVGYNLSPLLWRKVRRGLSAGRVQSVAVHMICDREKEVEAFVPEEYWTLMATLSNEKKEKFQAKLAKKGKDKLTVRSEAEMNEITASLQGVQYVVADILRREKVCNPLAPFTTSTLQQEASRKLNYTTKRTMMIAQQLYEGIDLGKEGPTGLLTYIRTDSTRVSSSAQDEAAQYVNETFGAEMLPKQKRVYASRGRVQDAHEAIRPTSVLRTPSSVRRYLSDEQYKLYELVWSRFVASQMASALFDQIRVDIQAGAYLFRATGSTLRFPGFLKVYIDDREEDKDDSPNGLPAMEIGDILKLARSLPKQHFTQPPPRYTEAALVRSLEELGIGRPSTYAPVVETVQRRGYVVRRGKNLHPTELGTVVDELLNEHFPDVINVEFTAEMEEKLDQVEEGGVDWVRVLEDFYQPFRQEVARAEEVIGRLKLEDEVTDEICVQCGRNMVIKMGRYGKFLACPGFPECRNARPITQETGHRCPKCDGNVVVRKTRKGKDFFGCDAYPKCDFVSWDPPIDEKCPTCGTFLVEKAAKKSKTVYCPHPNCDYKEKKAIGE
ncbi:MAG: type I DNA topoisomerase [Eubacteriales bacterium]|nr:type I DNA topoisomerase [Bacillota bacterium]MBV1728316.1 type I DNA topoisomerase [Desulforudis sp.]MDQ7789384.1 type I DNA topoisomerase [Clostridia bacterium]MDZ4042675.1 type I DNA topoisomerase [Eubacteriales bacterium]MBU4533928.1 type I DNA topoisomerase [Bacillota bacterium]